MIIITIVDHLLTTISDQKTFLQNFQKKIIVKRELYT